MESKVNVNFSGVVSSLLLVAFIVLKLTHVIDWSWLWVLSPLWISFGIAILILGIAAIVIALKK